jgi:DNA-directed RNA polymerase specialized sigma subunit
MENNKKMSAIENFNLGMDEALEKYYKDAISVNIKRVFRKEKLSTCKICNVNHCKV